MAASGGSLCHPIWFPGITSNLGGNGDSVFDPMPASVTVNAKRNQIFRYIMAELTSGIQMMDLQHFSGTAILASPSIPI